MFVENLGLKGRNDHREFSDGSVLKKQHLKT